MLQRNPTARRLGLGEGLGDKPDPLDVRQVGRGPTRWEGRKRVEKSRKMKVLRMKSSIVENVPTPWESLFELFPASQLPYRAKLNKILEQFKNQIFPVFSLLDRFGAIRY